MSVTSTRQIADSEAAYVPFHRASIGQGEIDAVTRVLRSGWLTTGPVAQSFEKDFAAFIGCKHAIAVNSGTAALQLALDAIGLRPGEEVLVPTYTFTATAEVVTYYGGHPVLCDSVKDGFNIDVQDAEHRITEKTRAIIPVHIAGQPCDMGALQRIARRHGLHVIEDAAHALPAKYNGTLVGAISDLTAFSFYATKTITTGEGGMLTTNNDQYSERASMMRLHGISGDAWKRYSREGSWFYEVISAGYKLNLCDVLAALGSVQLSKCTQFWRQRLKIAESYRQAFSEIEALELPPDAPTKGRHAWHLFVLRIRPDLLSITRAEFIDQLRKSGIGASVHFIPLHLHPFYAREYGYRPKDFSNAMDAYSRSISLPIFPGMTDVDVALVIKAVKQVVKSNSKKVLLAAG